MQSNPLDREMSARRPTLTCGILTAVIVGRQSRPVIRHHKII